MTAERKFDDEEAIWRVWDSLEEGSDTAFLPETGHLAEERQTLVRLYTETVGLYARGLVPAELPGDLKARVLGAVQVSPPVLPVLPLLPLLPEDSPPRAWASDPRTARAPVAPLPVADEIFELGHAPVGQVPLQRARPASVDSSFTSGAVRPLRRSRWPLAMAATLAVGFAGVAAYLWQQFEEQKAGVVRYESRIRLLGAQAQQASAVESELARARTNLSLVTSRGVWACALSPVGAARPGSHGMLYVAADHQHWMAAVEGLAPSPDRQEYQLWFLVGDRPVSGGTFRVEAGRRVELSSPTMPSGITAVAITLEPRGGMPRPTGPQVLFGDRLIEIL